MNTALYRFVVLLSFIALFSACVPVKKLTYLQDPEDKEPTSHQFQRSLYKIQPNDILNITIRNYDPETSSWFNIANANSGNALNAGDILFYLQGYSVNMAGKITMPVIGDIMVQGLSIEEVQQKVLQNCYQYFENNSIDVSVRLAGIRYSVVGEVARPGKYVIYQNQVNIFEALALAGDITMVGDRKEVIIVRQMPEKVELISLDLTSQEVLDNPYFFVQPNDIINIKPLPQKSLGIGTTGFETFTQILSVIASTITLIIAINSLN